MAGALDSLWPWSSRLRTALELLVLYAVMVAAGSPKAHDINGGTWPEAILFSALMFGGLGTFYMLLWSSSSRAVACADHKPHGIL